MDIAIGCDDVAIELKETIIEHLKERGQNPVDFGCGQAEVADYPDVAYKVAKEIQAGHFERAILICGTGLGVAITANKVKGVRAAVCHDTYSAERARKSNNAQVLTFGSRVIGPELAKSIVDAWLASEFQGGNSARKVDKIAHYESEEIGERDGQETH
ncbi:ribose 5-phosphate isomerase B [Alicyclobacillus fastidiosus]|uniref:Ribose 5-phosphate isomerase B n=1 Tax=Alicyclobacillus fastidiosus TaxID=392011 RepID=A0ABY6ZEA2_9BACL|nr:ribose 5-phosphate isomerase B [Alicyclobacillus fastidiosus]WAH41224.1 ribose 5-phosphate isomerase B [Alicyclobacillus fastidiosus]GMA62812.1 ribose-5-phosphate isomerase [Alicyclobacillus fastidiosus]